MLAAPALYVYIVSNTCASFARPEPDEGVTESQTRVISVGPSIV